MQLNLQMLLLVLLKPHSDNDVLTTYLSWLKTNDSLGLEIPCNISIVSPMPVVSCYVVLYKYISQQIGLGVVARYTL